MSRPTRLVMLLSTWLVAVITVSLASAAPAAARPVPAASAGSVKTAKLAATPPMGWNDWYAFKCNLNEALVEQTADTMVSSGMRDAGYRYVNLDDCWLAKTRDSNGALQADPVKFPHGIKAVADYVHARGLKLGIYEDVGTKTCAGYPGSYGHTEQDADTFASWGIDFAKIDWCNVPFGDFPGKSQQQVAIQLYTQYSKALKATGRPIVFSICEWNPKLEPWTWAPAISNLWRTNNDYGDTWDRILANVDEEAPLAQFAGPGHWNDPDILQVGLGGMSTAQDRAHFSAWSMLAAPLLAGNDLRSMSPETKAILTNREVIAIDQDRYGAEATRVGQTGDADVWTRPLANGDRAVLLLNRGTTALPITTTTRAIGMPRAHAYAVRDLWAHTTRESAGTISASVPGGSAVLYRVSTINGNPDQFPPATSVSVAAQIPAAFPGSTWHLAQPGQQIAVDGSLRNDGRSAITDARLTLDGPDGWPAGGAPVTGRRVASGATLSGTWQVTVPADARPGTYTVAGTGTYRWHNGARVAMAKGTGGIQVVVAPSGTTALTDLTWLSATNGYGPPVVDKNYYGGPLTVHAVTYPRGLWLNANASLSYYVGAGCTRFTADLGLDDSDRGTGTVDYQVFADDAKIYDSGVVTNATPTVHLDADVAGAHVLRIDVTDAGDGVNYDNADIGTPTLTCAG